VLERNKEQSMQNLNQIIQNHPNLKSKSKGYLKLTLSDAMFVGHNLWIFKPNDFNRGRGVHIFKSLDQLKKLIVEYTVGVEVNNATNTQPIRQDLELSVEE